MFPCESCDKRNQCVEPCQDLINDLKKVTVGRRERFVELKDSIPKNKWGLPATEKNAFDCGLTQKYRGDELKQKIVALYNEGKSEREIAYYQGVGCNHQYVHKVISAYKKSSAYHRAKQKVNIDRKLSKKRRTEIRFLKASILHGGFFERFK